jgi:hypothetical protein
VGFVVGLFVGDLEGPVVVGDSVGSAEGSEYVGPIDGIEVIGDNVGDVDGLPELGVMDGSMVGIVVDGDRDGLCDGSEIVGLNVGDVVGCEVYGETEGAIVGLAVVVKVDDALVVAVVEKEVISQAKLPVPKSSITLLRTSTVALQVDILIALTFK